MRFNRVKVRAKSKVAQEARTYPYNGMSLFRFDTQLAVTENDYLRSGKLDHNLNYN